MNPLSNVRIWLIFAGAVLCGGLVGWFVGNMNGRTEGREMERADYNAKAVNDLTGLINSHQSLISAASKASKEMRVALGKRAAQDTQTTLEFKDALSATADSRAGCVFPAGVMRQLAAASERAGQAAAGGIHHPLPGTSASAGRP